MILMTDSKTFPPGMLPDTLLPQLMPQVLLTNQAY